MARVASEITRVLVAIAVKLVLMASLRGSRSRPHRCGFDLLVDPRIMPANLQNTCDLGHSRIRLRQTEAYPPRRVHLDPRTPRSRTGPVRWGHCPTADSCGAAIPCRYSLTTS